MAAYTAPDKIRCGWISIPGRPPDHAGHDRSLRELQPRVVARRQVAVLPLRSQLCVGGGQPLGIAPAGAILRQANQDLHGLDESGRAVSVPARRRAVAAGERREERRSQGQGREEGTGCCDSGCAPAARAFSRRRRPSGPDGNRTRLLECHCPPAIRHSVDRRQASLLMRARCRRRPSTLKTGDRDKSPKPETFARSDELRAVARSQEADAAESAGHLRLRRGRECAHRPSKTKCR